MQQPPRVRRGYLRLVVATLGLGIAMLFLHASTCQAVDVTGSVAANSGSVSTVVAPEHSSPDDGCDHTNHTTATAAVSSSVPLDAQAFLGVVFLALGCLFLWAFSQEQHLRGTALRVRSPVPLAGRTLLRFVCVSRT